MDKIVFDNVLPLIFIEDKDLESDIWLNYFTLEKGHNYLIEANSGTGKSSLCSYLYGHRNDYAGNIIFDDIDIRTLKSNNWDKIRISNISLLFQELRLFPELTALENVQLKNNLSDFKTIQEIDDMFEVLGISSKKNSLVGRMSWGQQQRVALIRCLCQPFDFLLLDEPISHLDENNAFVVSQLLQQEVVKQGASIIATSIGKHLPLQYTKIFSL